MKWTLMSDHELEPDEIETLDELASEAVQATFCSVSKTVRGSGGQVQGFAFLLSNPEGLTVAVFASFGDEDDENRIVTAAGEP